MSESKKFKSWLVRLDPSGAFSLERLITRFAEDVLGKDPLSAEAYAQANANRRWNDVLALQDELKHKGAAPLLVDLDLLGRTGKYLATHPGRGALARWRGVRCASRSALLRGIDALNDRQYEGLACVVSSCAGADKVHLTPPGDEGGIDFFALIRNPAHCHVFSHTRSPLRIIGQCKKYSGPVGVDKVRQFIQTISSVCNQSPLTEKHVPTWFRSASGPVVGWIVGHSGFESGAYTLAQNHGIVLSDSLDMAEICAQSRQFPAPLAKIDYETFLKERVLQELNKY